MSATDCKVPVEKLRWVCDPALFSFGLQVTQHLATEERRRGASLFIAWQHSTLGRAIETEPEMLRSDRFTAGVVWLP